MGELRRVGSIEVSEDLAFARRSWRLERAGWIALGLFVAAGLLGLLGPGPFSDATVGRERGDLWVEYERFARNESEAALAVHFRPRRGSAVDLWLSREYVDALEIRGITPEPAEVTMDPGRVVFRFHVEPGEQPRAATFEITYRRIGRVSGSVGILGGESVSFAHWVWP